MERLPRPQEDALVTAMSYHLNTHDKRFMFLLCHFKRLSTKIHIEGSADHCSYNIYEEFRKQQMLGSLIACLNTTFDTNLDL